MYIQYYAKWRKTKSISAKVKNKTRVSTLFIQSQCCLESYLNNKAEEGNKSDKVGEEAKYPFLHLI